MVPAKGVERWLTQRLSPPARRRAARRRRGVRRRPVPQPALAGLAAARPRARRPLGPRPAGLAAARDDRRQPRRAVVRARWPPTSATGSTATTASCAATAATRSRAGWPGCSRRTPCSGRTLVTDWREGRDTDGAGDPLDDDLRWQAELWRRLLAAGRRRRRPTSGTPRRCERLRAGRRRARPARPALAVRPHPAAGHRGRAAPGARRAPRRPPLAAAALARAVGRPRRPRRRRSRATTTRSAERVAPPAARLARPRRPRAASHCSPASGRRRRGRSTSTPSPTPCSAGCSTTCAPTTPRRPRSAPAVGSRDDDRSLQVHACHGAGPPGRRAARGAGRAARGRPHARAARHPRDVPRHRDFAPLISAGFGLADVVEDPTAAAPRPPAAGPARRPRARPAPTRCSPSPPRWSSSPAAGSPPPTCSTWPPSEPCRRRFGFTDDDLDRVGPLGRRGRRPLGARRRARARGSRWSGSTHNTWRSGLDRILLGVAMSGDDHRHLGRGLPLDDVGSNDIDLAGRLAELVAPARRLPGAR